MNNYQILSETIDMFIEYRDKHGYSESEAKEKAVLEILDGEPQIILDTVS